MLLYKLMFIHTHIYTWIWTAQAHWCMGLLGECVNSLVLSRRSKILKQWTDRCYSSISFRKQRKIHPRGMRTGWPKRQDRRGLQLDFGSSFYVFFLLCLSLRCVNWASQEGCLFYLMSSDLPLFYFHGLFLLCLLATTILDSFFLF